MYTVIKELEISASHYLNLPYESKCANLHGHNWKVKIYCKARELSDYGMVEDFTHIKKCVMDVFDHQSINQVVPLIQQLKILQNIFVILFQRVTE